MTEVSGDRGEVRLAMLSVMGMLCQRGLGFPRPPCSPGNKGYRANSVIILYAMIKVQRLHSEHLEAQLFVLFGPS